MAAMPVSAGLGWQGRRQGPKTDMQVSRRKGKPQGPLCETDEMGEMHVAFVG